MVNEFLRYEFLRYVVVGGISFAADFATIVAFEETLLKAFSWGLYAAVVCGLVGLLPTELGMWLGVSILGIHYTLVKVVVTGGVLLWNYLARRLIVFGGSIRT